MAEHTLSDADNSKLSQNQHARSQLPRVRHIAATKSRSYSLSSLSIADGYLSLSLPPTSLYFSSSRDLCLRRNVQVRLHSRIHANSINYVSKRKKGCCVKKETSYLFPPIQPPPPLLSFAYRDLAISFVIFSHIVFSFSSPSILPRFYSLLRNPRRESESEHDC